MRQPTIRGLAPHHKSSEHRTSIGLTLRWKEQTLWIKLVPQGEDIWVGTESAQCVLPIEVLGAERIRLVAWRGAAPWVLAGPANEGASMEELPLGAARSVAIGDFVLDVTHEVAERRAFPGPRISGRSLGMHVASIALHVGAVLALACTESPVSSEEAQMEQVARMQQALMASAEREPEPSVSDPDRARGEAGSRFGVAGPPEATPRVYVSRASVPGREAMEFGMMGLMAQPPEGSRLPRSGANREPPSLIHGEGAPGSVRGIPGEDIEPFEDSPRDESTFEDHGTFPAVDPGEDPLSTFAVDVDTASYAITRRKLRDGHLPPPAAVRPEEIVNAFDYGYEGPSGNDDRPFAVYVEGAPSPFATGHHLVRVGVQGKRIAPKARPPAHLVYLVDTSGSMDADDKMGLVKASLRVLTQGLGPRDTVALCTYAGGVREVLPPTGAAHKESILRAIDDLTTEGGTAMASGIALAYGLAERTLVPGEMSRVIILSDGDANVGPSSQDELTEMIRDKRGRGITLSTVGFGEGNYRDNVMEALADQGDGNYTYVDSEREARRAFGAQLGSTLTVIARDVKIQVEFDPHTVKSYRLIGYENRDVADADFRRDHVDGGEIGAGHHVTAMYDVEFRPAAWAPDTKPGVVVRLRHKEPLHGARPPEDDPAVESVYEMDRDSVSPSFLRADRRFQFAAGVVGFAEILRRNPDAAAWSMRDVSRIVASAAGDNEEAQELVDLVRLAHALEGGEK